MTCRIGDGIIVCSAGPWFPRLNVECPWCLEKRRCLRAPVHGGWSGYDFICGACGSYWDSESETIRKISEEQRGKNILQVAAMPDPKCWDCYDTGYLEMSPIDEEAEQCNCGAPPKEAV